MEKSALIHHLQTNIAKPQKSERWAMYRLISPVVDFANATLGLEPYFEFNQTSGHGTSQSVDIALLADRMPQVMVEAKKIGRGISDEHIQKYLKSGVRGLVTNGAHWILCLNEQSKILLLACPERLSVSNDVLDEIVAFIRGEKISDSGWSGARRYVDPLVIPAKPIKLSVANKMSNPSVVATDANTLKIEVAKLKHISELEKLLLSSMMDQLKKQGEFPIHLRCEVRSSRVVFFDERISLGSRRVARIEVGKKQPDILVKTNLVGTEGGLSELASCQLHDKGSYMRRFRLSDKVQTVKFGNTLASMLST